MGPRNICKASTKLYTVRKAIQTTTKTKKKHENYFARQNEKSNDRIVCAHHLMPNSGHLIDLEFNAVALSIFFLGLMEINFASILILHL